jgi:hypothetical protein
MNGSCTYSTILRLFLSGVHLRRRHLLEVESEERWSSIHRHWKGWVPSRPLTPLAHPHLGMVYMLFSFLQNQQRHAEVREEQQDREGRGWMSGEGKAGGEAGWLCIDFRFLFPSFSLPTPPSPP